MKPGPLAKALADTALFVLCLFALYIAFYICN